MNDDTTTSADSWSALLQHVIEEGRDTPKCQVERAVGPILGAFIGPLMSAVLKSDVVLIAAEFPLLKKRFAKVGAAAGYESTNIDWLMYDVTEQQLILLELKTEAGSVSVSQLEIYQEVAKIDKPWDVLRSDLADIAGESKNVKYRNYRKRIDDRIGGLGDIGTTKARIVYLAPDSCRDQLQVLDSNARFVSFGDLRNAMEVNPDLRSNPMVVKLCEALVALDESIEGDEALSPGDDAAGRGRNYQAMISFDQLLDVCKRDPSILVGYSGGASALRKTELETLRERDFKWDWPAGHAHARGGKNEANWMPGEKFISIIESMVASRRRSEGEHRQLLDAIDSALRSNPARRLGELLIAAASSSGQAVESISDMALVERLLSTRLP